MPYYHPPEPTVGDRLRSLGDYLSDLACRVRQLAAEAIGDTLGRLVKDASHQFLNQVVASPGQHSVVVRDDAGDPWEEAEEYYDDLPNQPNAAPSPVRSVGRTVLAGVLWGAGWWLRRRRSPWMAAAVAASAVVASIFTSFGITGVGEMNAAADLLAVHDAFQAGARVLSGP